MSCGTCASILSTGSCFTPSMPTTIDASTLTRSGDGECGGGVNSGVARTVEHRYVVRWTNQLVWMGEGVVGAPRNACIHALLVLRHFYVFAPAPWVLLLPPFAEHTEPAAAANVVDRVAVPTDRLKPSVRPGFSPFRGQLFVWLGTLG